MKTRDFSWLGMMLLLFASVTIADEAVKIEADDSTKVVAVETVEADEYDQIIVSYMHMNRRCATCEKLETYSDEAVATGFSDELSDSSIVWRVLNFELAGNEHFAKEYQLFSQSLILSKVNDGKELEWKNLDKIWELVSDKDQFIAYVQDEVKAFMKAADKK